MGGKSQDPYKAERRAERDRLKRLSDIDLPELEEYILQSPELVGLLEAEQLGPSALEEIQLDPSLRANQMQALEGLRERSETGMTEMDKLQMEEMLGQAAAQEKSQRSAIDAEMERRGTADSGTALMQKLQASQGSGNQSRRQAMQQAAQAQQAKMAALQGMGQMAGQMGQQDFSRQAQVASARDAIAKANAMNRQQTAAANLASRQNIENQRAGIANQQAQVANQIAQQNFNNRMARAGSMNSVAATPTAPAGPSGFQKLATIGGAVAGGFAGGPGGIGAGAQAGSAIGGALGFEDGGIVDSREMKAHEKFKSDYMKRVREELAPQKQAAKEVTGRLHAEDGTIAGYEDGGMPNMLDFNKANEDLENSSRTGQAQGGIEEITGITNDKIDSQEMRKKSGMKLYKEALQKGLGAANDLANLLNPKQEAPARIKNTFQLQQAENIMSPIQAQQFGNPMANRHFQFEDGGLYKGTKCAEDGDIMFDSEGEGAVVGGDSFERDRVDARLNSGEAVLNVAQQQRLMDLLRGEADIDDLGEEDIVEGVPREYQEELTKEIDNGKDTKMEGLKKLLKALGE